MQIIIMKIIDIYYHPRLHVWMKFLFCLFMFGMSSHVFADGTDMLQGTSGDAISTFDGTGKKYIYLAEGIVAAIAFIISRNPKVLIGILILAIFMNDIVGHFVTQS